MVLKFLILVKDKFLSKQLTNTQRGFGPFFLGMIMNNVLHFLTATTKQNLMTEMHKIQVLHGKKFHFSTPTKDGKNYITWFETDIYEFSNKEKALESNGKK